VNLSKKFIVIIDAWDAIFREEKLNKGIQDKYVNFLRVWQNKKKGSDCNPPLSCLKKRDRIAE
jgi:hypothetical protein